MPVRAIQAKKKRPARKARQLQNNINNQQQQNLREPEVPSSSSQVQKPNGQRQKNKGAGAQRNKVPDEPCVADVEANPDAKLSDDGWALFADLFAASV
ncbi:unnamed protein product [Notodromas monacha]|uniref:Uncharacterized protein n=1 Tax=Notodromas monacha TaxID=399045 RepID=A0A7R9BII5_9CRUS|nr:unnamed protein product [Notodromas monacha]CAG0915347.1 unnamed protein product [Notodromas monacha]